MTELSAPSGVEREVVEHESRMGHDINGGPLPSERETDILDEEEAVQENKEAIHASDMSRSTAFGLLSSEILPAAQGLVKRELLTGGREQQQIVSCQLSDTYNVKDREKLVNRGQCAKNKYPSPLSPPDTPPRGISSRKAVLNTLADEDGTSVIHNTTTTDNTLCKHTHLSEQPGQEEELTDMATDMDESIEQLNQLILDLDPTFIPVPTRCAPLSRTVSLCSNGLSSGGNGHKAGWQQERQASDVTEYSFFNSPGWRDSRTQMWNSPVNGGSPIPSQLRSPCRMDSVTDSCDIVPSTPAFPVSPPTPYVKGLSEISQLEAMRPWQPNRTAEDSLSFLDSMNHAGSTEGELFRADMCVTPDSCQGMFSSMHTVSSSSPLPHTYSPTPAPAWLDGTPSSLRSPFQSQCLPPLSLSRPRGALKGLGAPHTDMVEMGESNMSPITLANGSLEHSLLEAMEGLGGLGLSLGLGLEDGGLLPLLPEKRRGSEGGELHSYSPSLSGFSSPNSGSCLSIPFIPEPLRGFSGACSPGTDLSGSKQDTVKFVQDTSKFWYKPDISRDQAIAVLKDKEPGSFIVRDSHSFRGAYGLAMKVATPPPSVLQQSKKVGDLSNELVRHFLIECTQKGVRLKGCPNEPYFGSLTALVCQHSITPLALPCKLILPDKDPMEEFNDSSAQTATNSAAELLKQGAACNVWYLGSVELESLTGHQAVQKATSQILAIDNPSSTGVHFKVSAQGITLTDNQRKLFFRRHYTVNTVIFCSLDPQARKWTREGGSTAKIFGFVARKSQSGTENMCHLFAEHDPEQPASAIVNFVSKVMIGSHKK